MGIWQYYGGGNSGGVQLPTVNIKIPTTTISSTATYSGAIVLDWPTTGERCYDVYCDTNTIFTIGTGVQPFGYAKIILWIHQLSPGNYVNTLPPISAVKYAGNLVPAPLNLTVGPVDTFSFDTSDGGRTITGG